MDAMSVPLYLLQSTQDRARFSSVDTPTVLTTDDVVHLMGEARVVVTDEAVFALPVGAVGNLAPHFLRDISGHRRESGGPWLWPFAECALAP